MSNPTPSDIPEGIHSKESCVAPCPFHAPSDHPLKDAEIHIRWDKGALAERICKHGVGHDDPDAVAYMKKQGHEWAGAHGCDGCCTELKVLDEIPEEIQLQAMLGGHTIDPNVYVNKKVIPYKDIYIIVAESEDSYDVSWTREETEEL